ncbi:hypothetical protein B0H14DRAFT_3587665 [Mycena olivaceomarginata]|nr:hypothetical protein B0H14DRAFT_3587665 [Mycena olivaceomarginata]
MQHPHRWNQIGIRNTTRMHLRLQLCKTRTAPCLWTSLPHSFMVLLAPDSWFSFGDDCDTSMPAFTLDLRFRFQGSMALVSPVFSLPASAAFRIEAATDKFRLPCNISRNLSMRQPLLCQESPDGCAALPPLKHRYSHPFDSITLQPLFFRAGPELTDTDNNARRNFLYVGNTYIAQLEYSSLWFFPFVQPEYNVSVVACITPTLIGSTEGLPALFFLWCLTYQMAPQPWNSS